MSDQPRILVVEESPEVREGLRARLEAEGFAVTALTSSFDSLRSLRTTLSKGPRPEAVARVEGSSVGGVTALGTRPFDLVLLTMSLTNPDGIDIYQALRTDPTTRQTPVIVVTEIVGENYWEALPYDADGPCFVMGKSGEPSLLLARMTQLLAQVRR